MQDALTEAEMTEILTDALTQYAEDDSAHPSIRHADRFKVKTFADASLLGDDAGLVIRIDKMEFQVTIVRSR